MKLRLLLLFNVVASLGLAASKPVGLSAYLGALNACSLASASANQATLDAKGRLKIDAPQFESAMQRFKASLKAFEGVSPSNAAFLASHKTLLAELHGEFESLEALGKAAKKNDTRASEHASARAMIHAREYLGAYRQFKALSKAGAPKKAVK